MRDDAIEFIERVDNPVERERSREYVFKTNNDRISSRAAARRDARRRIEAIELAKEMGVDVNDIQLLVPSES